MVRRTEPEMDFAAEIQRQSTVDSGLRSERLGRTIRRFGVGHRAALPGRRSARDRQCSIYLGHQADKVGGSRSERRQCCSAGWFGFVEELARNDQLLGVPIGLLLEHVVRKN